MGPGQAAPNGTRMPPSNLCGLNPPSGPFVAAEQRRDAVPLMGVVVDAVVAVTKEDVEPPLERQEPLGLAHVPLPNDAGVVAGAAEDVADRLLVDVQAERHFWRKGV